MQVQQLYQYAVKCLARREHSVHELQQKLRQKYLDNQLIAAVIAELTAKKLQSDERFTEAYVRMRLQRGYGPLRISQELKDRGIATDLIDAIMTVYQGQWRNQIHQVRCKKFGNALPKDLMQRMQQMRFLHYRGFSPSQIKMVLNDDE